MGGIFDLEQNPAVKWAAKERSGFADPSSTACSKLILYALLPCLLRHEANQLQSEGFSLNRLK